MIYYSIILNDELDFVKLQLDVNYDYVDKFVITESGQTYSGNKKENHFSLKTVYLKKLKYQNVT